MDFEEIRRVTITALFSDEVLLEQLVLKGGNALSLVHGLSERTSLDLDFSMEADFADVEDARRRIFYAVKDRFDAIGYVVFDEILAAKPRLGAVDEKPWWGGYELRFKLIERAKFETHKARTEKLRINATVIGSAQERTFKVDLSKFEYTVNKEAHDFDDYRIYVYSPEMIVIEKLRAICQQFHDYPHIGRPSARARDFYDIHCVLTIRGIDLSNEQNLELARQIFAIKQVPLAFISRIHEQREFHRPDWQAVIDSTKNQLEEFDYYFDFVISQAQRLQALWIEEPPPGAVIPFTKVMG